jgi:hypothetical protein
MADKNLSNYFYGDQVRWFIGVVEEVGTDEPKLGRVRVRIYGIHGDRSQVPIGDLPQAQVLVPTTEPGVSGLGRNPYLSAGATVFGIFLDGKASQLPLILGSLPVIEVPTADQLANPVGPAAESGVLPYGENIIKAGVRTNTGNTATIQSAKLGGNTSTEANTSVGPNASADQLDAASAGYPSSLADRKQIAFNYFVSAGWTSAQSAGIVGNLVAESNLIPVAKGDIGLHAPTDVSIGIAQWYNGGNSKRPRNLYEFAAKRGKAWYDFRIQLEFVNHELNTSEKSAGKALRAATTPTKAALVIHRKYERPKLTGALSPIDGKPSRLHEQKRVNVANEVYNAFTRKV